MRNSLAARVDELAEDLSSIRDVVCSHNDRIEDLEYPRLAALRQPPNDTPEVEAVVEAAKAWLRGEPNASEELVRAVDALTTKRKEIEK